MIDFSLTKIKHPLYLIPEKPAKSFSKLDEFSEEEGFNSDMEDDNDHDEERENPPQNNRPWLARDSLAIPGRVHNLP